MKYRDLREFIAGLEADGKLKRIQHPVSPHLEMTEIADRVLRAEGPALLFENPIKPDGTRYDYPVLANLFGTPERVAMGMGADSVSKLRENRADAGVFERTRTAQRYQRRVFQTTVAERHLEHGAERGEKRAMSGNCVGRRRR